MFCPLHAYTEFAACSGLAVAIAQEQAKPTPDREYVAMWPRYSRDQGVDPFHAATEDQHDRLLGPVLRATYKLNPQLAKKCPTGHSLRVVGLIWYLRCQVVQHKAKLSGRWLGLNLKSWDKYVRGGEEKAEEYRRAQKVDPVFMFWCARDSFVGFVN
jgi:hypothetical protein